MLDSIIVDTVIDELTKTETRINSLVATKTSCDEIIPSMENKLASIEDTLTMISESREYLRKAIDVIYSRSVGELNDRLNTAIKYIYFDRDLSVKLELEDKRGKGLRIVLLDEEGNELSVKHSCGMGVRTIISVVLHMYYLLSMNSKILLVDEKYSYLSESYVPRFFEFINRLCEATGFKLIIITHDKRFMEYSKMKLRVKNGEVTVE